jgi:hypothetical protein
MSRDDKVASADRIPMGGRGSARRLWNAELRAHR